MVRFLERLEVTASKLAMQEGKNPSRRLEGALSRVNFMPDGRVKVIRLAVKQHRFRTTAQVLVEDGPRVHKLLFKVSPHFHTRESNRNQPGHDVLLELNKITLVRDGSKKEIVNK